MRFFVFWRGSFAYIPVGEGCERTEAFVTARIRHLLAPEVVPPHGSPWRVRPDIAVLYLGFEEGGRRGRRHKQSKATCLETPHVSCGLVILYIRYHLIEWTFSTRSFAEVLVVKISTCGTMWCNGQSDHFAIMESIIVGYNCCGVSGRGLQQRQHV